MNTKILAFLLMLPFVSFTMEKPDQKKQLIEEIKNYTITLPKALERIKEGCNDDVALKSFACAYLYVSPFDALEQLKEYRAQNIDDSTREIIDSLDWMIDKYLQDPLIAASELQKEKAVLFFLVLD